MDGGIHPPNFWMGNTHYLLSPQFFVIKSNVVVQISWLHYTLLLQTPSIKPGNNLEKWTLSLDYL